MSLIGLLVAILIIVVIVWAVRTLIPVLGLPQPIATVIYVILVVVVVLWLVGLLTGSSLVRF